MVFGSFDKENVVNKYSINYNLILKLDFLKALITNKKTIIILFKLNFC